MHVQIIYIYISNFSLPGARSLKLKKDYLDQTLQVPRKWDMALSKQVLVTLSDVL